VVNCFAACVYDARKTASAVVAPSSVNKSDVALTVNLHGIV
jgi:hypothetical protein